MNKPHLLSSLTITALLLFILGIGNVVMGRLKLTDYDQTLSESIQVTGATPNPDSLLMRRIASRKRFYTIVSQGGVALIALSLGVLGLSFLKARRSSPLRRDRTGASPLN